MRRIGLVLVAVVLGLTLASCSNTMTKAEFKAELDNAGVGGAGNGSNREDSTGTESARPGAGYAAEAAGHQRRAD